MRNICAGGTTNSENIVMLWGCPENPKLSVSFRQKHTHTFRAPLVALCLYTTSTENKEKTLMKQGAVSMYHPAHGLGLWLDAGYD